MLTKDALELHTLEECRVGGYKLSDFLWEMPADPDHNGSMVLNLPVQEMARHGILLESFTADQMLGGAMGDAGTRMHTGGWTWMDGHG